MVGSKKKLVIGVAATGAKYTPYNAEGSPDFPIEQIIKQGKLIPTTPEDLVAEATLAYSKGARYYHIHARNPETHEQTTDVN